MNYRLGLLSPYRGRKKRMLAVTCRMQSMFSCMAQLENSTKCTAPYTLLQPSGHEITPTAFNYDHFMADTTRSPRPASTRFPETHLWPGKWGAAGQGSMPAWQYDQLPSASFHYKIKPGKEMLKWSTDRLHCHGFSSCIRT